MAIIKIGARDMTPLFMAGLRSLVASVCIYAWMKVRRIQLFPSKIALLHGMVPGLLFGMEFGLIYMGLQYTLASRVFVLLYTAPFFVALGAHYFLKDDALNPWKVIGLNMAFVGVLILFIEDFGQFSFSTLPGDLMALASGALWGVTTVYIKRYLAHLTVPLQTLFYQLCFSAPLLFVSSFILEKNIFIRLSWALGFSLLYQCIIVAFLSFLVWFELIHRYPVSLLHAFSFFTPILGVIMSGVLILGEIISTNLILALILVCVGMVFVNRKPGEKTRRGEEVQV